MPENILPLMSMIFLVSLILLISVSYMVLSYRKYRRLMELHHVERMAAIERGMEIPPLPIEDLVRPRDRRRTALLPGLIWLFVGLALIVGLQECKGFDGFSVWGLLPAGVGLAYLIVYLVEDRKAQGQRAERESAQSPKVDS